MRSGCTGCGAYHIPSEVCGPPGPCEVRLTVFPQSADLSRTIFRYLSTLSIRVLGLLVGENLVRIMEHNRPGNEIVETLTLSARQHEDQ
jgi:hypothetical protein